MSRSFHNRFPT